MATLLGWLLAVSSAIWPQGTEIVVHEVRRTYEDLALRVYLLRAADETEARLEAARRLEWEDPR
jgi:hypothetical protein